MEEDDIDWLVLVEDNELWLVGATSLLSMNNDGSARPVNDNDNANANVGE